MPKSPRNQIVRIKPRPFGTVRKYLVSYASEKPSGATTYRNLNILGIGIEHALKVAMAHKLKTDKNRIESIQEA